MSTAMVTRGHSLQGEKMSSQVYVKPPAEVAKKKKWSIGNLFRRKSRRSVSSSSSSSSSTSDQEHDDNHKKKGGFLARRKKRNERGSKDVTDSFTVISPPTINSIATTPPSATSSSIISAVPRGTPESGRSGSLTSLEGRRRTKARVEASRELLAAESSSCEEEEFVVVSSQTGSLPHSRKTRSARTERYKRRLSKETIDVGDLTNMNNNHRKWRPSVHSASTSPVQSPTSRRGLHHHPHYQHQYPGAFRSASYDGNLQIRVRQSPTPTPPPPPPPRRYDPPRPMSYAFETNAPDPTRSPVGSLNRVHAFRTTSEQQIPSPGVRQNYYNSNHHHQYYQQQQPRVAYSPTDQRKLSQQQQLQPVPAPRTSLKLSSPQPTTPHTRRISSSTTANPTPHHDALVRPFNYNNYAVESFNNKYTTRSPLAKLDYNVHAGDLKTSDNNFVLAQPRRAMNGVSSRNSHDASLAEPTLTNGITSEMNQTNPGLTNISQQPVNKVQPVQDATQFWRQKDMLAARSLNMIMTAAINSNLERSRSTSPRPQESVRPRICHKRSDSGGSTKSESSTVSSLTRRKEEDVRPLSIVVEKSEHSDVESSTKLKPPTPPERKSSRQSSVSSAADFEKRTSNNLEDALHELEEIYRSLKESEQEAAAASESVGKASVRFVESDSGMNYDTSRNRYARTTDDMAYRRLNKKEQSCLQDSRDLVSRAGSYLLVSPTLSPPPLWNFMSSPGKEPDITFDDVVYRSINHTNNTLRICDPQPPFGIPLVPVAPAAESDYLHATPSSTPRPPSTTPDVVTDDLAFRNLRKDSTQESTLSLKKKKAVRSLSANLSGYIGRDSSFDFGYGYYTSSSTLSGPEVNNNDVIPEMAKLPGKAKTMTASKTLDGAEGMRLAQRRMLEIRRRAIIKNEEERSHEAPAVLESQNSLSKKTRNEELRRRFFSEAYRQLEESSESQLLQQIEDEARATSHQIDKELLQLQSSSSSSASTKGQQRRREEPDTRSVAELLKELTKSLDQDFGKACEACGAVDNTKKQQSHATGAPPSTTTAMLPVAAEQERRLETYRQCSDEVVQPLDSADSGVLVSIVK